MTSYEERLRTLPSEPERAANYSELLLMWEHIRLWEDRTPAEIAKLDERVAALLTERELTYYRDETKLLGRNALIGRINRLTGILLGRQSTFLPVPSERKAPQPLEDPSE